MVRRTDLKMPYGVWDFKTIRNEGLDYVGETEYLAKIDESDRFAFFVRPRRFGKSLFAGGGGSARKMIRLASLVAALGATGAVSAARIPLENGRWRLEIDTVGGVLQVAASKDVGVGFTIDGAGGLFTESSWDRWHSRDKLRKAAFEVKAGAKDGRIDAKAVGQTEQGGIPFLRVAKRFVSEPDSTALSIDYRFINTPDAMSIQSYSPSLHLPLAMTNRVVTFFYPTEKGVVGRRQTSGSSITCKDPSRGWYAVVDEQEAVGAVLTFPEEEVNGFWTWLPGVPSTEIKFQPVGIENGASHALKLELQPFRGLKAVTGAGGGFVGSLKGGVAQVVSARACTAEVSWPGGKRTLTFRKPGELVAFDAAGEVVLKVDGREVCRIAAAEAKALPPTVPRRPAFSCEADLSSFTNFPKFNLRPWAKPLAGGPVRVSVISGQCNLMEIGALAECFDMDYRALGVIVAAGEKRSLNNPQYAFGDFFGRIGPKDMEREVNRMIAREADVILLGGIPLDALPESSLKLLREAVAKGRGLVLVGNDDKLKDETFGSDRVIRLDYPAMPRVAAYLISGITPDLRDFYPDRAPDFEAYYSRVAKAVLRAAGRAPKDGAKGDVDWVAYNSFREKLAEGTGRLPDASQLPSYAGTISVDYSIRQRGKVVDWGTCVMTNAPAAEITSLTPEKGCVLEGEDVTLSAKVRGACGGMRMRFRFYDVHDRLLDERVATAAADVTATFRAESALLTRSFHYTAELLSAGGRVVSKRRGRLAARPKAEKLVWDDYSVATCGDSLTRYYLYPQLAAAYRSAMITYASGQWPVRETLAPFYNFATSDSVHIGLQREGGHAATYAKTGDKMTLVRSNCLSNPDQLASCTNFLRRVYGDSLYRRGFRSFGFGDEMSLTDHEGRPIDFCFSPHCLKEFRRFAKSRYGTLERLNETYESDFRSWDEVLPFTRDEVWKAGGRHVAGWSDHLEFMDNLVTNRLTAVIGVLRTLDPNLRFTLSGTQPPAAYSGMDWSKVMQCLTGTEGYSIGGQYDLHRSFCPQGRFSPWSTGYALRGNAAVSALWNSVFHGCHGTTAFWSRSQFAPDLTPSHCVTDVLPSLERLAHGTGKYLMNCLVPDHSVAILYSQASFRGAFIENRRGEHDRLQERCRRLLRRLGVGLDYVSSDQVRRGELVRRGYRAVFLVDAVAMGDGEADAIRAFADKGGAVVAINEPATRRADCRMRPRSVFAGWFDGRCRRLVRPGAENDDDRAAFKDALTAAGVATEMLKIRTKGCEPRVFVAHDGAGNRFWGVLSDDFAGRKTTFAFPQRGYVYDLVDGRSYGETSEVTTVLGKGKPHAFVQLTEAMGVSACVADGTTVRIETGGTVDTVVRVTVTRPDGTDAAHYAQNLLVKGGKASFVVPFCLSDPLGRWTVGVQNVLGGEKRSCVIAR